MILLTEHAESSLAAKKKRQHGASSWPTSTPKNRVWNFAKPPSGRINTGHRSSWENATGSVQFTYENASGRAEWLSRDPLKNAEMREGPNLYEYVKNDPTRFIDPLGLCPCGQHLELDTEAFSETVETMTGGGAVDALGVSAFSLAHSSPATAGAISSAMSEAGMGENLGPLVFDAAEVADPPLTLYGVAVDTGAALGSLHCVADDPDNPSGGYPVPPPGYPNSVPSFGLLSGPH